MSSKKKNNQEDNDVIVSSVIEKSKKDNNISYRFTGITQLFILKYSKDLFSEIPCDKCWEIS